MLTAHVLSVMQESKDDDGEDDYWLVDAIDGIVRTLEQDCESPMLTDAKGEPLQHVKGDRVVDCYFWIRTCETLHSTVTTAGA